MYIVRYQDFLFTPCFDKQGALTSLKKTPISLLGRDSVDVRFTKVEFEWLCNDNMDFDKYLSRAEKQMLCAFCTHLWKEGFDVSPSSNCEREGFVIATFKRITHSRNLKSLSRALNP